MDTSKPGSIPESTSLTLGEVVSRDFPVVISKYINNAKEVEMDAVGGGWAHCGPLWGVGERGE